MSEQFRTCIMTVDAMQWTGTNIAELQALLAPGSPLLAGLEKPTHVGVMCDRVNKGTYDASHDLQHADVNDWVVKYPSGRVAIIKAAHFAEYFEPVDAVATAELEVGRVLGDALIDATGETPFPLGGPIDATHPRALADRQPTLEADEATVTER